MKTTLITLALTLAVLPVFGCGPTGIADPAPQFDATAPAFTTPEDVLPEGSWSFGPTADRPAFCGNNLPPATLPLGLPAPEIRQRGGKWCVLTTIEMTAKYYGLDLVDQCRLADQREGFPEGTCCTWPIGLACDAEGTNYEEMTAALSRLGLYGTVVPEPVSEDALINEVSNGRLTFLGIAGSGGAHSILVSGFDPADEAFGTPARFEVLDPGDGWHLLSYNELRSRYWNGYSVWTTTVMRVAAAADGCNLQFDPTCGCTPHSEEDAVPAEPFGGYDRSLYGNDALVPTAHAEFVLYEARPAGEPLPPWNAYGATIASVATHAGARGISWCEATSMLLPHAGDCCRHDANFADIATGFPTPVDESGVANPTMPAPLDAAPNVSCAQRPSTWNVSATLAAAGVQGLHASRRLSLPELRREMANRRQVVARSNVGNGTGALVTIAGWAPVDESVGGGEQFLVSRHGTDFHWVSASMLMEGKDYFLHRWTDTWYRLRAAH